MSVDRVVVLALDGMRPDLLRPGLTPNLCTLRDQGELFVGARSVFPSYTRVCTASVMAGAPPAVHGIVGNAFHHRAAGPAGVLFLDRPEDLQRLIDADGAASLASTLDQVLAEHGRTLAALNGNTAGTARLMMPNARKAGHWLFNPNGRDGAGMPEAWDAVVARFGEPPGPSVPLIERTTWLGRVFAELVVEELDPDVAFLWLAEPDTSLHYRGLHDPATELALRAADAAVGLSLEALRRRNRSERTAVLVFSDHGQITCPDQIALPDAWQALGIGTRSDPELSATMVVGRCGGISLLRGVCDDAETDLQRLRHLTAELQGRPELGMIFSRPGDPVIPGTLPYSSAGVDHARAPDLIFVLRDSAGPDCAGFRGQGWTPSGNIPAGGGMHGGLHEMEVSNLLLIDVPGRSPATRTAPAGLIDIAPTILGLLGLEASHSMTGRSLLDPDPHFEIERFEVGAGPYRQRLEIARMGRAQYVLSGGRCA